MKKIAALVLSIVMGLSVVGCSNTNTNGGGTDSSSNTYKSGKYTAIATGNNGDITVEVEFNESSIVGISVIESKETEGLGDIAMDKVISQIVDGQTLAVDVVSGATNSSNALLEAVEKCATEAGGNIDVLKTKTESESENKVEEIETDVVVVGAGASGSLAALAAVNNGASVILLEKAGTVSGAGTMAGGLFAADSNQQKEAGKEVDKEWLYEQYVKDSSYYANSRLITKIIDEAGKTVNYLEENGVNLLLMDSGAGAQYAHVGMPSTIHYYQDGGSVAIQTLHDKVVDNGGQVLYETPGEELIFDKDNKVAGVIAKKADGTTLKINAKSVILATGGFGGNAEMMAEVFGEKAGTGLIGTATGDGLNMAWSAGAAEEGIEIAQWFGMKYGPEAKQMENSSKLTELVRNPLLFVNNRGERFCNEEEAYESAALGTYMYNQPDGDMYIILNDSIINEVAEKGLAEVFADRWGHLYGQGLTYQEAGHVKDLDAMCETNRTPYDYSSTIEDAVKCGVAFQADSIEKLAELINAPYLVEEVNNYNEMCKNGKDTQFYKESKYMYSLEEGTFYAVKVDLRCLGTLGGVKINENIQAVDEEGNPIENLWVAGADAGGLYGNNYVMFEGGTLGFAYTSGRLAGENAAKNAISE